MRGTRERAPELSIHSPNMSKQVKQRLNTCHLHSGQNVQLNSTVCSCCSCCCCCCTRPYRVASELGLRFATKVNTQLPITENRFYGPMILWNHLWARTSVPQFENLELMQCAWVLVDLVWDFPTFPTLISWDFRGRLSRAAICDRRVHFKTHMSVVLVQQTATKSKNDFQYCKRTSGSATKSISGSLCSRCTEWLVITSPMHMVHGRRVQAHVHASAALYMHACRYAPQLQVPSDHCVCTCTRLREVQY